MALTAQQLAEQKKQAEELLAGEEHKLGFGKSLFFGHFQGRLLFPYPELKRGRERPIVEARRSRRCAVRRRPHRRRRHRPRRRHPARVIDGLAELGCPGHDGAAGVRRPRLLAARLHARSWKSSAATSAVGRVRQRPSLASASARCCCSAPRSSKALAARPGHRPEARRLRADRTGGRLRRRQRADHRHADARRQDLHPQRREALHHQRRHRRGADRDGPHAGRRARTKPRSPRSSSRRTCRASRCVEARMPKCGIRGTATGRLAFHNMPVPKENILGQLGKGLRMAPDGARLRPHHLRRQLHRRAPRPASRPR